MIQNKFVLITLLLFINLLNAQKEQSNIVLGYAEEHELGFYEYEPKLKVKATMTAMSEAKNQYPEELMTSILSATNQKWVNYNTLSKGVKKKDPSHFEKIKKMSKDENYFELHHKLSFKLGNIPTVLIKFFVHEENQQPISACYVMQKVNNRWQRTANTNLSLLSIIVMRLKSDVLKGIVTGKSTNKAINAIRDRVTTNDMLDVKKLEKEFESWYSPKKDEYKIQMYKDPKSW